MIGLGEILLALAIACIAGVGLWLALGRDLIGIVVGLALVGTASNLFLFAAGRVVSHVPPLVPDGATTVNGVVANPLPQALVLTAIVITFGMTAFVVILMLRSFLETGSDHVDGDAVPCDAQDGLGDADTQDAAS